MRPHNESIKDSVLGEHHDSRKSMLSSDWKHFADQCEQFEQAPASAIMKMSIEMARDCTFPLSKHLRQQSWKCPLKWHGTVPFPWASTCVSHHENVHWNGVGLYLSLEQAPASAIMNMSIEMAWDCTFPLSLVMTRRVCQYVTEWGTTGLTSEAPRYCSTGVTTTSTGYAGSEQRHHDCLLTGAFV
jgi:hypothetical protein